MKKSITQVMATLCLGAAALQGADLPVAPVAAYPVDRAHGQAVFSAMVAHPNGKVYMGTCTHGGFAHLVELNPRTGKVRDVADMQDVTGQRDPEMIPQSKIHTQIVVDKQNRLWFGTWAEEFRSRTHSKGYPGGHLISYDPATDQCTNHGILFPQLVERPKAVSEHGGYLIAIAINARKDTLYILTGDTVRLVIYDIATGKHFTAGEVPTTGDPHYAIRDLEVAADGNVYLFDTFGQLRRYVPASRKIEPLEIWIPGSDGKRANVPFQMAIDPTGRRIYGSGSGTTKLFELLVEAGKPMSIKDLGPSFGTRGLVRNSQICGMTVGGNGTLYYGSGGGGALFAYEPARGKVHVGQLQTTNQSPPAQARYVGAAYTAPDGTIYLGGTFELSGKPALCFMQYKP